MRCESQALPGPGFSLFSEGRSIAAVAACLSAVRQRATETVAVSQLQWIDAGPPPAKWSQDAGQELI